MSTPSQIPNDDPPPRILIIDDNPRIHRDFELVFLDESENAELDADDQRVYGMPAPARPAKPEYALDHAHSGLEGVEKVTQAKATGQPYQVAFVDIRMPGIDGVETIERIWQVDSSIQVVICTAYADYSQEDLVRHLGHTDKLLLLKKPFDSIEVTQLARTLTHKWQLNRQAALKLEQMELLVSQRTQKVLDLQQRESRRLHELGEMKLQFLNNLAKELREPLSRLVESLEQTPARGAAETAQKDSIRRHAEQLTQAVDQLKDYRALDGGEPKSPPAPDSHSASDESEAAEASSPDGLEETPPGKDGPPRASSSILLIEHDPDVALYIRRALGDEVRLIESKDGAAGLTQARDVVPDLIIADIFKPQIDGVELCRKLKAELATSHIPVILLAMHDGADHQLAALEAGADDYVYQSFGLSTLKARVENLLEFRRRLRARFQDNLSLHPRDLALGQTDAQFLQRAISVVERNLSDFEFDVEIMARNVAVSRRQLFRKLKALLDTTPKAFIRSVRLKRAAQLLTESQMTITEITFAVGFQDVKHFRALFKEQFGMLPSEYLKSLPDSPPRDV